MSEAIIEFDQGPLVVARWGRVIVTFVGTQPDRRFMEIAQEVGRSLGGRDPGRVASLTLVSPSGRPPDSEVGDFSKQLTRESDAWIGARATVVAAQGFVGSVARSVLTTITAVARGPEQKVFASAEPAVAWLGSRIDLPLLDQRGLTRWCDEMLARGALRGHANVTTT